MPHSQTITVTPVVITITGSTGSHKTVAPVVLHTPVLSIATQPVAPSPAVTTTPGKVKHN